MLVMNPEQEKSWEEIKGILSENGISFVNLEEKNENFYNIYKVSNRIRETVTTQHNEHFVKSNYTFLAIMAQKMGWVKDSLEMTFHKDAPEDYDSTYTLRATLEEEFENQMKEKDEEMYEDFEDWVRDYVSDFLYDFDADSMEIGYYESFPVKIPEKKETYKF